jgi:small-conductance mechanosensitive channel
MNQILAIMKQVTLPVAIVITTLLVGYIIRGIILVRFSKLPGNGFPKRVINIIKGPMVIWFLMLGIYVALEFSVIPQNIVDIAGKILLALGILSITIVAVNLSTAFITKHSGAIEGVMPITSLTQNIARIIILCIGILVMFNSIGIPIAPILATLGVGGLAVALALQDTLSNIFSGFYIIISRQLRIGDYVKLDSGEEGYITDITWRSTQIKALANNVILIPNEKLTKAIATNYYLPDKEMAFGVQIGVHYNSDLDTVEKITVEVAKEVMQQVEGGVPEFEPAVRFHTFADSSINFSIGLKVKEFTSQYLIKHEFIKRLQKRYAKEGIIIPYPIRAINYSQEKSVTENNPA